MNEFEPHFRALWEFDYGLEQERALSDPKHRFSSFADRCEAVCHSLNSLDRSLNFLIEANSYFQSGIDSLRAVGISEDELKQNLMKRKEIENLIDKYEKLRSLTPPQDTVSKIKVVLSVAELGCFVKLLYEGGIIDKKSNSNQTELCRTIAQIFETKQSKSISSDNLRNKFITVDPSAARAVEIKLRNLLALLRSSDKF